MAKKSTKNNIAFLIAVSKNLVVSLETQCISEECTYNVVHGDSTNEIQATLSLDNPTEC